MTHALMLRSAVVVLALLSCTKNFIESKSFVLKASKIVSRPLNVPVEQFREWFSLSDLPTRLVLLNPGVEKVEILNESCHRGLLKPIQFPWTKIKCSIDYDINFNKGKSLAVNCREDAVTQIFEGSELFVNAMSSLKLVVAGSANFYINEPTESFCVGVSARVSFPVPDYYPSILLKSMESAGTAILQSKVEYDLGTLLENVLETYGVWAEEKNKETSRERYVEGRPRQFKTIAV